LGFSLDWEGARGKVGSIRRVGRVRKGRKVKTVKASIYNLKISIKIN